MKYIRADLLMNKIAESAFFSAAEKGKIRAAIEKEPGEDVTPVVHAHWVYGYTFPDGQYRKCSACNELIKAVANDGNFCGHCGAKMDICELCEEHGWHDCKRCNLGNPCIGCADYDMWNDTCKSNGACGDFNKGHKEEGNARPDTGSNV